MVGVLGYFCHPSSHPSPPFREADLAGLPSRAPLLPVGGWPLGQWEKQEAVVLLPQSYSIDLTAQL